MTNGVIKGDQLSKLVQLTVTEGQLKKVQFLSYLDWARMSA
jgi:hypothetical protein